MLCGTEHLKNGFGARTAHVGKNRTIRKMRRPAVNAAHNILSGPERETAKMG